MRREGKSQAEIGRRLGDTILPKPRIELTEVKGRHKALNRKNRRITYLGVSALIVVFAYLIWAFVLTPPAVPDFELQVNDWQYNPSLGSFQVSGTIGIQIPHPYSYLLIFDSITDGNKTIVVRNYKYGKTSTTFGGYRGPDWGFLLTQGITLESKNVQLTFEYKISHGGDGNYIVLKRGTKVFSVNVE